MNKLKIVWLLAVVLCLGACSKHEKNYNNVTPPVVESADYIITGVVTDFFGRKVANATVQTPGLDPVTTNKNGVYVMQVPEPKPENSYTLTASGKDSEGEAQTKSETVTVTKPDSGDGATYFCNIQFHKVRVFQLTNGEGEQDTDHLDGNDDAECLVGAYVEGYEGDDLYLNTYYFTEDFGGEQETPDQTSGTFEKEKLFFASTVTNGEKDGTRLLYTLSFNFNTETQDNVEIRSFSNGQWAVVPESDMIHESDKLTIKNALTSVIYAVFCNSIISLTSSNTPLVFDPSDVDNTYGASPVPVPFTDFSYRTGVQLYQTNNQLQALLLELIGRDFGSLWFTTSYRWNVNLTLPVGTGVGFSGNQEYIHIKYKKLFRTAEADLYGDVTYGATTYNHQHIGGGN